jgi:hypothetical protein
MTFTERVAAGQHAGGQRSIDVARRLDILVADARRGGTTHAQRIAARKAAAK